MLVRGMDSRGREVGRAVKGKDSWSVMVSGLRITVVTIGQARQALGVYGAVEFTKENKVTWRAKYEPQ